MGFRHSEPFVVCGQEIRAGFCGTKYCFHNQAVIDTLPMRRKPNREFADQLFIGLVEIKLDCFTARMF
jgi:hypothetical protein